jgi:hypothetical protein
MDAKRQLGAFLQTRRSQLRPQDVGLATYGDRRRGAGSAPRGAGTVTQQSLRSEDDRVVVVATAEPGSPSQAALTLLVHSAVTTTAVEARR